MADPQRRADVLEIAALAAATDSEGRVDPMAYEAQRLMLQNQRLGSIDADALMRDLQRSPGFEQFDRDAFLHAVDARLDSPAEKKRFAEALDPANIGILRITTDCTSKLNSLLTCVSLPVLASPGSILEHLWDYF